MVDRAEEIVLEEELMSYKDKLDKRNTMKPRQDWVALCMFDMKPLYVLKRDVVVFRLASCDWSIFREMLDELPHYFGEFGEFEIGCL